MRPVLLTLAFVAAAAPAVDRAPPAATPAGKPESCIRLTDIRESRVRDDRTIDFIMRGRDRVYRNTLPYSCPSLGFEQRFGYATSLSQLCSTDIITVLYTSPLQRGASCGLGQFQPVTLAKVKSAAAPAPALLCACIQAPVAQLDGALSTGGKWPEDEITEKL